MQKITLKEYIAGFVLSILFTAIPFTMVMTKVADRGTLIAGMVASAIIQLVIQLKFFLHLKPDNKDSMFSFLFTALILIIIVFGSLWVMYDLNYFMMDPVMQELGHQH